MMSSQTNEKNANVEQSSTQDESTPYASGSVTIRRPRPGSVVILAAAGTPVMVSGTAEYMRVVLGLDLGE
jgi:hypothetical protein